MIGLFCLVGAIVIIGGVFYLLQPKAKAMDINAFAKMVTELEGKKTQVNIAQVKEVLHVANDLLEGKLYDIIKTGKIR